MNSDGAIEFWFEFSSPYAYFAGLAIDDLGRRHERTVIWRPFLLGAAFKRTGMAPLTQQDLRGAYARRDWARLARRAGVPFMLPEPFPILSLAPARLTYAVAQTAPERAAGFARALLVALYAEGRNIADAAVAAEVGAECGFGRAVLRAAADDPRWKDALRKATDEALARGVFGSPFMFVDGEPFWGADRLPMIEDWLTRGGW